MFSRKKYNTIFLKIIFFCGEKREKMPDKVLIVNGSRFADLVLKL